MTCPAMMLLSIIAVHVLLHSQADAVEVVFGDAVSRHAERRNRGEK